MTKEGASESYRTAIKDLITANHILHYNKVLDAYGHISFRNPDNPDIFILSGDQAPALVSSAKDLIEYNVSDSAAVDPSAGKGFKERFIHSEIYKRFPEVNSVVHSHSEAVLPYTVSDSSTELKPTFHIAGFLGTKVPVYNITTSYDNWDIQDMLINNDRFGFELANHFSKRGSWEVDHAVVLMTNHGFTTVGTSIKQAVYRAVYTCVNADVQTKAMMINHAQTNLPAYGGNLTFLSEKQTIGSQKLNDATIGRPWGLWAREVEVCPLYRNDEA